MKSLYWLVSTVLLLFFTGFCAAAESFVIPAAGGTLKLQSGDVDLVAPVSALPTDTRAYILPNPLAPRAPSYVEDTAYSISRPELTFTSPRVLLGIHYDPFNIQADTQRVPFICTSCSTTAGFHLDPFWTPRSV